MIVSSVSTVRIISPPDYPHSQCFHEVAEAFAQALGFAGAVSKQRLRETDRCLVFGSHLIPYLPKFEWPSKDDILYQSEVVTPECSWFTPAYIRLLKQHEVWDYSPRNVDELKKLGIQAKLVPIRYMPCMTKIKNKPPAEQDIDVLFYGSMNERRDTIIKGLLAEGVEVYKAFNVYGKERDDLISRAKIVLNIHQYDHSSFEIFRCAHLFSNRKCVVTEISKNDRELDCYYSGCAYFARQDNAEDLISLCRSALKSDTPHGDLAFAQFEEFSLADELQRLGVIS